MAATIMKRESRLHLLIFFWADSSCSRHSAEQYSFDGEIEMPHVLQCLWAANCPLPFWDKAAGNAAGGIYVSPRESPWGGPRQPPLCANGKELFLGVDQSVKKGARQWEKRFSLARRKGSVSSLSERICGRRTLGVGREPFVKLSRRRPSCPL